MKKIAGAIIALGVLLVFGAIGQSDMEIVAGYATGAQTPFGVTLGIIGGGMVAVLFGILFMGYLKERERTTRRRFVTVDKCR